MSEEKKITQEMLDWPCEFTVETDTAFKVDRVFKLALPKVTWNCRGMKLRDLMGETGFGAFGGNSYRVKNATRQREALKSQAEADAWKAKVEKTGIDVQGLIDKPSKTVEVDPVVWAAGKSKEEIAKKIAELEALSK